MERRKFRLGPPVIQRLLPHRPPLLFVDFVAGYERSPRPSLQAGRYISANDPTFMGHFPELGIWPGVYTVEGLNQACTLLSTIAALQQEWEASGKDPMQVLEGLRYIDQVYELKPTLRVDSANSVLEMLRTGERRLGLSAGIDIRFTAPVFPGSRLDYVVHQTHNDAAAMLYDVEASVDGSPVAKGKLTLSRGRSMPSPPT